MIFNTAEQAVLYPCFLQSIYSQETQQRQQVLHNAHALRDVQILYRLSVPPLVQEDPEPFIKAQLTVPQAGQVRITLSGYALPQSVYCDLLQTNDYTITSGPFCGTRLFLFPGAALQATSTAVELCISCITLAQSAPKLSIFSQTQKAQLEPSDSAADTAAHQPLSQLSFLSAGYNVLLTAQQNGILMSLLPGIGKGTHTVTPANFDTVYSVPGDVSTEFQDRTKTAQGLKSINGVFGNVFIQGIGSVTVTNELSNNPKQLSLTIKQENA